MPNFELGEKRDFAIVYMTKKLFFVQQKFHNFPENRGFGGN